MKKICFVVSMIAMLGNTLVSAQAFSTPGFSTTTIGAGWDLPMGVAFSKDGQKLFVWEKAGKVFVCNRNASGLYDKQDIPVLDISDEVGNWGDHGLNGFALDPEFHANGLIYLLYVVDKRVLTGNNSIPVDKWNEATIGRITRYQVVNNAGILSIDPSTRVILLGESVSTGIAVLHDSHGMGSLVFASDGTLLASAGDGGSYNGADEGSFGDTHYQDALGTGIIRSNENVGAFRAQMINSHNGKILRINPANGNGMPSNPFYNSTAPRSPQSRVWALGFRNPFRFNIRPGTGSTNSSAGDIGEIYVGDVGWRTYEELNIIKAPGMNCGWPIYEGHTITANNAGEQSYSTSTVLNKDEANPLYNGTSCNRQFFRFNELLKQATADGLTTVYNPCNSSQAIGSGNRYFHRRPSIDWQQYTNNARVPTFNGNLATTAQVGSAASGVAGTPYPGNCSIAGFWYTGTLFPVQYRNTYFHGEYGADWIKSFTINFTDVVQKVENFASGFTALVCMVENPLDGTVYYVDIGDADHASVIKRVTFGGNQSPVVIMSSDVKYGPSTLNVSFIGSDSYDPEGGNLTYTWNFGDGTPNSTSANVTHAFTTPNNNPKKYLVTLTVKDIANATAVDSIIISVNNTPPNVHITSPVNNSLYRVGVDSVYTFTADVGDEEHGPNLLRYEWQKFLRHNNHEHPGVIDTSRLTSGAINRIGCNGETYYWLIRLRVFDAAGLSTLDSVKIFPACAPGSLPLVLRKFSVTQQGSVNQVKWSTESAMHIKSFEIERGDDGHNFFTIYQKQANSNAGINEYSFPDHNFPSGDLYYRLKMNEIGDVIKYSAIVKVSSDIKTEKLVISPNPVIGNFSIKYSALANGPVTIRIMDINGKAVRTIRESVNRGQNIIYLQNEPTWRAGVYIVSVQQGSDVQQGKLVKAE
jgi:glucose/arabinose dehydrogenase